VTAQLQAMFRAGTAAMREALPVLLGTAAPPPSFSDVCRDWTLAIRSVPPGFIPGASRLASPPPCSLALPEVDAWEEILPASPVLLLPATPAQGSDARVIPTCWEDAVEDAVPIAVLPAYDRTSGTLHVVPATTTAASLLATTGDADLLRPFLATVSSVVP
jgi:hypothetical protein